MMHPTSFSSKHVCACALLAALACTLLVASANSPAEPVPESRGDWPIPHSVYVGPMIRDKIDLLTPLWSERLHYVPHSWLADVIILDRLRPYQIKLMDSPNQYISVFRNAKVLDNKARLLARMRAVYTPDEIEAMTPETYFFKVVKAPDRVQITGDVNAFLNCYTYRQAVATPDVLRRNDTPIQSLCTGDDDSLWIMKLADTCCGDGITIVRSRAAVWEHLHAQRASSSLVVQLYMQNTHLLRGVKYDLRILVLILSLDPLVVMISDDFYVRLGSKPYDPNAPLSDKSVHLTNVSVQKKYKSETFAPESALTALEFHQILRETGELDRFLYYTMPRIDEHITKVMRLHDVNSHRRLSFQIVGFDILLRDDLYPYFIEVNTGPGLAYNNTRNFVSSKVFYTGMRDIMLDYRPYLDTDKCAFVVNGTEVRHVAPWRMLHCGKIEPITTP